MRLRKGPIAPILVSWAHEPRIVWPCVKHLVIWLNELFCLRGLLSTLLLPNAEGRSALFHARFSWEQFPCRRKERESAADAAVGRGGEWAIDSSVGSILKMCDPSIVSTVLWIKNLAKKNRFSIQRILNLHSPSWEESEAGIGRAGWYKRGGWETRANKLQGPLEHDYARSMNEGSITRTLDGYFS